MTDYITDDLSSFDRQLVQLARSIMDSEAPALPNRLWFEDSLFRAMQTFAATRQGESEEAVLAACERIGRLKALSYATLAQTAA